MTHDLWTKLNDKIYEYLASVTLGDLVESQHVKNIAVLQDKREAVQAGKSAAYV